MKSYSNLTELMQALQDTLQDRAGAFDLLDESTAEPITETWYSGTKPYLKYIGTEITLPYGGTINTSLGCVSFGDETHLCLFVCPEWWGNLCEACEAEYYANL